MFAALPPDDDDEEGRERERVFERCFWDEENTTSLLPSSYYSFFFDPIRRELSLFFPLFSERFFFLFSRHFELARSQPLFFFNLRSASG